MKKKELVKQLREKTIDELKMEIQNTQRELEKSTIEQGFSGVKNPRERRNVRKKRARAWTILKEKLVSKSK